MVIDQALDLACLVNDSGCGVVIPPDSGPNLCELSFLLEKNKFDMIDEPQRALLSGRLIQEIE